MISYRGRADNVVYEISKPIKWGFRSYILVGLNTSFTYWFKLLDEIDENNLDEKMAKCIIWSQFLSFLPNDKKKENIF